ncbi:hypothetical protein F5884DRAFT_852499 [Xylogone sp. PMI_703]|nr:hypothetical protein F5884DRAFT_852499 [Xylogone sp. PMI_703]
MFFILFYLILLRIASATFDLSQAPLLPDDSTFRPNNLSAVKNANHIFNAIHSAMRQWGSSLKHNGMSFFPATVPKGALLYHGTGEVERVTGMEWLAFEIEHAHMFSWKIIHDPDIGVEPGYFQVYQTTRPLNLLYIDGMGAAKSYLGTLDTQDKVLLGTNLTAIDDYARGKELCILGEKWAIDGFIRMEGGFEIIYCNFSEGLDFLSHNQVSQFGELNRRNNINLFEYIRSVSSRYNGIGTSRVSLDYSSMVSAFFFDGNLTNPDPEMDMPRLENLSPTELSSIRAEVAKIVDRQQPHPVIDWQGVVDLVVSRFSDRLQFIVEEPKYGVLSEAVGSLVDIYIDHAVPFNETAAIEACTSHYLQGVSPSTSQDLLIYTSISTVTNRICNTLFNARKLLLAHQDEDEKCQKKIISQTVNITKGLINWLDWSTWTRCGQCQYDEVCFIAFFPFGSSEDHYHPRCRNNTGLINANRFGSWWRYKFPDSDTQEVESMLRNWFHS